jgi:hypothetical protein
MSLRFGTIRPLRIFRTDTTGRTIRRMTPDYWGHNRISIWLAETRRLRMSGSDTSPSLFNSRAVKGDSRLRRKEISFCYDERH